MKILAVGGGSGGHVTPVVAVLREIRKTSPDAEIEFWCDASFVSQARGLIHAFDDDIPVSTIISGKLRRYHHWKFWDYVEHPGTVLANIRDVFKIISGIGQSYIKLAALRPDVVFVKGGFVGVPVGVAAHLLGIPIVIHDSDAHPGLANRIVARWATRIATGAPLKFYPYPHAKSQYIGTPVDDAFRVLSKEEQAERKRSIGVKSSQKLVVVTGGGLGAKRLNDVVITTLPELTKHAYVILISGTGQYDELNAIAPSTENYTLIPFVSKGMAEYLGAADVVVARAGATSILELAALAKPTVLVPNAHLTGGHQVKNAEVYAEKNAAIVLKDDDIVETPDVLAKAVIELLTDAAQANEMGARFHEFARPAAARDMAQILLDVAK